MNSIKIGVAVCVLILLALGAFWLASSGQRPVETPVPTGDSSPIAENEDWRKTLEQPSGKIDEHLTIDNTLRDVNFCGQMYKVKQVLIDGVDVVQRVAEIATKNLVPKEADPYGDTAERICENVHRNEKDIFETLEVSSAIQVTKGEKAKWYELLTTGFDFSVNANTNEIYELDTSGLNDLGNPIGLLK